LPQECYIINANEKGLLLIVTTGPGGDGTNAGGEGGASYAGNQGNTDQHHRYHTSLPRILAPYTLISSSVADLHPDPDPKDPYVFGLSGSASGSLVRDMNPDPSIIKQK
jgi:hypothetical protein